ncbi:hypothetical protein LRP49_03440 [Enterovibrio sp. ZSDZ35]|uniref:DUF2607 domain-containing protein n=1 Tax=Enterovibrio qingdaonensis TaxID=2899818 RepID=A0ABT5QGZ9_9GAMM|nr:hypothetical protein [Enterovibrio sp. ZSDZ35]MDD1780246.1 hypothetical protein [Enterovibrio sp. ZSDZ35]
MSTLLRNIMPLLLAILIGWQGVAFAEHKGSHHHETSIDHHCVLCALGLPSTSPPTSTQILPLIGNFETFEYTFSSYSLRNPIANARDPPNKRNNVFYG